MPKEISESKTTTITDAMIERATHFDRKEKALFVASSMDPVSIFVERKDANRAIKRTIKNRIADGFHDEWADETKYRILPVSQT